MDPLLELLVEQGVITAEQDVRAGWFYRSDQISFARVGVPAIWFKSGIDFIGREPGWGEARQAEWIENDYHQPSDEVRESWVLDGLAEEMFRVLKPGARYACSEYLLTPHFDWNDEEHVTLHKSFLPTLAATQSMYSLSDSCSTPNAISFMSRTISTGVPLNTRPSRITISMASSPFGGHASCRS